jgi:hypothetical protein
MADNTLTLDEQIADAERDMVDASTFTDRRRASERFEELNARKLASLLARTDPATGAIRDHVTAPDPMDRYLGTDHPRHDATEPASTEWPVAEARSTRP